MVSKEIDRRLEWLEFYNPCVIKVFNLRFEMCPILENCDDFMDSDVVLNSVCPKKLAFDVAGRILRGRSKNSEEYIKNHACWMDEDEKRAMWEIFGDEADEMVSEVKMCCEKSEIITPKLLNNSLLFEKEVLEKIKKLGSEIEGKKTDEVALEKVKELKSATQEALSIGLSKLDIVAKLAVIFGMEERVPQLADVPSFRDGKIKLRHTQLENI